MKIRLTPQFIQWVKSLSDKRAVAKVKARLIQMEAGSFGDVKPCGEGVSESRIHYGPGYRIYFIQHGPVLIIMLGGGTKQKQGNDIIKAKILAKELEE